MRSLLVTVGSTRFDDLIEALSGNLERFKEMISLFQIEQVTIQYGKCEASVLRPFKSVQNVRLVDYLPPSEMTALLASATVVIAHGGAGTAFELLRSNKQIERFVMVENPGLMDSHQSELIDVLIAMGCPVIRGSIEDIYNSVADAVPVKQFNLPSSNSKVLISILDSVFFNEK